jgi:hypothetical protein
MTRARHFRLLAEQYAREAKHIATPTLKARHDELTRALSALAERYEAEEERGFVKTA